MKNLLFVVHGMGKYQVRWENQIEAALRDAADSHDLADRFDDDVTIVPITYDQVFDQTLADLKKAEEAMTSALAIAGLSSQLDKLLATVSRTPDRESGFWESGGDVLLYRYAPDVTTRVRQVVLDQMTRALRRRSYDTRVHVMAHSLGTAVAHDCLDLLAQYPYGGGEAFLARNARGLFDTLFMIANVSEAVTNDRPFRSSFVRPVGAGEPVYCLRYFDFGHRNDPFLSIPFPGWTCDSYTRVQTTAVHEWNLHGFVHYLSDPRVHVPVLNTLLAEMGEPIPISSEVAEEAYRRHEATAMDPQVVNRFLNFATPFLKGLGKQPGAFHVAAMAAAVACYPKEGG